MSRTILSDNIRNDCILIFNPIVPYIMGPIYRLVSFSVEHVNHTYAVTTARVFF